MQRLPLDIHDRLHPDMEQYITTYGWHFSKKAFYEAIRDMRKKSPDGKQEPVTPYDKENVDALLKKHGVNLDNDILYDATYICNMALADYFGSSITDEKHLALFIKDTLDDIDGSDELPFRYWCQKRIATGKPILWEDIL